MHMYIHLVYVISLPTAQNNSFVDERAAQNMCYAPRDTVPPLIEMSARAVHNYGIAWDSISLPTCLQGT